MNILIEEAVLRQKNYLIKMNLTLMEDEKFDRIVSSEVLEKKWESYLTDSNYRIIFFKQSDNIIGYALVQQDLSPNYLRHFFIENEYRRKGIGTICFNLLLNHLSLESLDLDAMSWNERGLEFWKSLGFNERCKMMTLNTSS